MNEESQKTPEHPIAEQEDWFLQSLVSMVNAGVLKMDITLQVSGFLVSGTLVSAEKYFIGFASDFASLCSNQDDADNVRQDFSRFSETAKVAKDNPDEPLPAYIHLEQAQCFNTSGNPIPTTRGVWWRGRLSEVSGFFLGKLTGERRRP